MKSTTKQPTTRKATKNRITALLLALLLVSTILSPQIPVKAQDTTIESADISENNSSGGTSAGAGDKLPTDTSSNDASFETVFHYKFKDGLRMRDDHKTYSVRLKGEGHFNIRSVETYNSTNKSHDYRVFIFSDMPFTTEGPLIEVLDGETTLHEKWNNSDFGTSKRNFGNGSYYCYEVFVGSYDESDEFISFNSPNKISLTFPTGVYDPNLQKIIENTLDLTKDDYKSDEDKANMTPVRDESIGYLPRCHYYSTQKDSILDGTGATVQGYFGTIQWDSFQERYLDYDNRYYIEIYAECNYILKSDNKIKHYELYHYKKYGDVKYTDERISFINVEPCNLYLKSIGLEYSDVKERDVSKYYVRLLHYDYDKQQVLCGGWTRLTLDGNGGCTSETGDFDPDRDDEWIPDDDSDDSYKDEWGDDGDIKPPSPTPSPDEPDIGIDTSSISAFIVSAITSFLNAFKSILSLVGEFPDLCKHVFSFLPDEISTLMFGGVAAIVVLRFLGR